MTGASGEIKHKNTGITKAVQIVFDVNTHNMREAMKQASEELHKWEGQSLISKETILKTKAALMSLKAGLKGDTSSIDYKTRSYAETMKGIGKKEDKVAKEGISILKKTFGIIENVYQKIQNASPLLSSINSLFNLAVQLFFMPLGNKLAEVMLPAVLQLVDDVMAMWDAFEGKSLSEIISKVVDKGVNIFGNYFVNLGQILSDTSNPLLSSIGHALEVLGDFIRDDLAGLLSTGIDLISFIISHVKEIISTIVAFKVASLAHQVSSMALITMATNRILWTIAAAVANPVAGTTTAAASSVELTTASAALLASSSLIGTGAGIGTEIYLSTKSAASGGYVPATDGGQWYKLGEGGEGEYIVPESKRDDFFKKMLTDIDRGDYSTTSTSSGVATSTNNYYITVNGYTDTDLSSKIKEVVNEMNTQNRLRSGF